MSSSPVFDCGALIDQLDAQRADRSLPWTALAQELWEQSAVLNARLADPCLCPGALVRLARRRSAMSCQYALILLRWMNRAPEDFLIGASRHVGDATLPTAGPGDRLRWDLSLVHAEMNEQRAERRMTWDQLADEFGCTANRITNFRKARLADMVLTMQVTQWLARPAAAFIRPAQW